ncbi:hypothetical protein [Pseudomonas sp.]|uniref:hypothetical protein n=1 Tax=Pseudomonas sp. TaxID=306 RepID=UPI003D6E5C7A
MPEVERYWIDPSRLVQKGGHQDDTCVVKDWAYDRAVAERDALQQRLTDADQWNDELLGLLRKAAEFEVGENDNEGWQHLLSQISLQLTPIGSLKPVEGGGNE